MKIKLSFLIAISIFMFSCGNREKEQKDEVVTKTEDIKTDTAVSTEAAPVTAVTPYKNQLEFEKIKFTITSPQSATANTFTVEPSGFTMSNDTLTLDCDGTVVQSEVWDLDGDKSPELLVVTKSGADKKGKAFVFSGNKNKSMSMVSLPDISGDPKKSKGYAGQDEFAFVESSFSHRFPLYENGKPLNKTRQFQYKLKPGEAMKQLVLDKTIEY